jgi:hypothetical protein
LTAAGDVLKQILHAVSAAVLTGDPRPVADTSTWIVELMQTRGVEVSQVRELGTLLADTLVDYPNAHDLVERHFPNGLA